MSWFNENTPEVAKAFSELRNAVYKEGALDQRTKELISVAASALMRCERCTEIHAERAKKHGATNEQIAEAVACAMFVAAGSQLSWSEVYSRIMEEKQE
ncbi:MAG: carboxymuconolactone decarboxylase family protein [Candidatus Methanoperedens sp.]|nr:carboxymuconolactone decarboxylase family protein [Candidatus Methanoperedens sp.]MCZ7370356.1 carboxymuconolactone decarboxylase family protein [Candidatus Methanoperedens sp.]